MSISIPPAGDEAKKLGSYFTPLKVEAQSTPNMTVRVSAGAFWSVDREFQEYLGGNTPTITAPSTSSQWVLIVVSASGTLSVVYGGESASPTLPAASTYTDKLPLAAIILSAGNTAITNDMIYDLRPLWQITPEDFDETVLTDYATKTYVDNADALKADLDGTSDSDFSLNKGGLSPTVVQLLAAGSNAAIRYNPAAVAGSPVATGWQFTGDGATWYDFAPDLNTGNFYTSSEVDSLIIGFVNDTGDTMSGNLVMTSGAEVTGLPATPSATGASSKEYVDTQITTHTHVTADITDLNPQVESVNSVTPVGGNVTLALTDIGGSVSDLDDVDTTGVSTNDILYYNGAEWLPATPFLNTPGDVSASLSPNDGEALMFSGTNFISRDIVLADVADFVDSNFLHTTGNESKTGNLSITGNLTVDGQLSFTDPVIEIDAGLTEGGGGTSGIQIIIAGSPGVDAVFQYDNGAGQWEIGTAGDLARVLREGDAFASTDITDFNSAVDTRADARIAASNADALADITYTGLATGDHLVYTGAAWENQAFADDVAAEIGNANIEDLNNVVVNSVADGDFLRYNVGGSPATSWVNRAGILKSDITDFVEGDYVQTTGAQAITGSLDITGSFSTTGSFAAGDILATFNDGDLADIVTNNLSSGIQIDRTAATNATVVWNDALDQWEAGLVGSTAKILLEGDAFTVSDITDFAAGVTTELGNNQLTDLGNVVTGGSPALTAGDYLQYNGANWVNTPLSLTTADITDFDPADYVLLTAASQTITGDFTIDGQFATSDTVIQVNDGEAGAGVAGGTGTAGLRVDRGSETDAIILWDDNTDTWEVGTVGSTTEISVLGHTHLWADVTDAAAAATLTEVGYLSGVTSNVQTQLDAKPDIIGGSPAVANNLAALDGANGIIDSGFAGSDFATASHTHLVADITDFDPADYVLLTSGTAQAIASDIDVTGDVTITGDFAVSDTSMTLNLGDAGDIVTNDGAVAIQVERTGNNAIIRWNDAVDAWEVGTVGSTAEILTGAHTHVVADITDFSAGVTTELASNNLDALQDVTYSSPSVGRVLRHTGAAWTDAVLVLADISDFVDSDFLHTTGNETKTGNLTIDGQFVTSDPLIELNDGEAGFGVGNGSGVAGITIDRGASGSPAYAPAQLLWNESSGQWTITEGTGATLTTSTLISGAHTHYLADITDLPSGTATALAADYLNGVTSNVQTQIDTHIADETLHLTADQNTFLDALNLAGSPLLTATEVNHLSGVTSNVQAQIDGKSDLGHTHTASEITDFSTAVTTELNANSIDELSDVVITAPTVGQLLEYSAGNWVNTSATKFVNRQDSVNESINGEKTFTDNVLISADLTVTGTTTTINTANLTVTDRNITLNHGYVGPSSGSTGSGLHVNRGVAGSPLTDYAVLQWDDATERWEGGIIGNEDALAIENQTVAQPHYEIVDAGGSPVSGTFDLGFDVPMPAAGKSAIQVFVNGIKQIEGATKAYQVSYGVGSPAHVQVVFNAGSEPSSGDDVEFYGFGYIG